MTAEDISALVTCVAVGGGGLGAIVHFLRRFVKKLDTFFSDWNGTPGRPGVPEKRGVMVRLVAIESEISYTHGSSIKDAVHRIDDNVSALTASRMGTE